MNPLECIRLDHVPNVGNYEYFIKKKYLKKETNLNKIILRQH